MWYITHMADNPNITKLRPGTEVNPDMLLERAKGDFVSVIVIGIREDGMLEFRATEDVTYADSVYYLEAVKTQFLLRN